MRAPANMCTANKMNRDNFDGNFCTYAAMNRGKGAEKINSIEIRAFVHFIVCRGKRNTGTPLVRSKRAGAFPEVVIYFKLGGIFFVVDSREEWKRNNDCRYEFDAERGHEREKVQRQRREKGEKLKKKNAVTHFPRRVICRLQVTVSTRKGEFDE